MDNVVPGELRRLREADIVSMAGLKLAALGQEYYRKGTVHEAVRQSAELTGIVEVPDTIHEEAASATDTVGEVTEQIDARPGRYRVKIEIRGRSSWSTTCTCNITSGSFYICPHAAALLYQWLARPESFVSPDPDSPEALNGDQKLVRATLAVTRSELAPASPAQPDKDAEYVQQVGSSPTSTPVQPGSAAEMLSQLGLNELRSIAREYDITKTGLSKQQLVETMLEILQQPEAVRRVVGTLEKPQRQLLAAITLAGGAVTDDELRGLYERFSLGYPSQLQGILATLRSKGLLFRTGFNNPAQPRLGLVSSLLEVGWYVPAEVHAALRVTVPVTPFDINAAGEGAEAPQIEQARPYALLEDLLLVARALDGYQPGINGVVTTGTISRAPTGNLAAVPPPTGIPSPVLLASLQKSVPRTAAFLRFAICLLRLVDILYKDDSETSYRVLPNAARLLLGPTSLEVARDLFKRWLSQATYVELFDLQEEGLRLCWRSVQPGRPALLTGELEMENSEARQSLIALLAKVPFNKWISFPAFARFVYRLNPAFLQSRHGVFSSPSWWLELEDGRVLHPEQLNDWMRAEGCYLARLLRGPLHWWGICDLVLSSNGQLQAFRLTPLAEVLLQANQAVVESRFVVNSRSIAPDEKAEALNREEAATPILKVSDSDDLLIRCSAEAWPLIELVEEYAEVAGVVVAPRFNEGPPVGEARLRYRLTAKSLSDALHRGLHPTALLQGLRSYAGPDETDEPVGAGTLAIPRLLARLQQRVANYGRVRLYTDVTLLEVSDTPVMRELSAVTSLDDLVVRTIHPTMMILKKQGVERIVQDLKRRGQAPLLHEGEATFLADR